MAQVWKTWTRKGLKGSNPFTSAFVRCSFSESGFSLANILMKDANMKSDDEIRKEFDEVKQQLEQQVLIGFGPRNPFKFYVIAGLITLVLLGISFWHPW
jgi:hypothetical protein